MKITLTQENGEPIEIESDHLTTRRGLANGLSQYQRKPGLPIIVKETWTDIKKLSGPKHAFSKPQTVEAVDDSAPDISDRTITPDEDQDEVDDSE